MSQGRPTLKSLTDPGGNCPRGRNQQRDRILQTSNFNPSELCSRKLWQIVANPQGESLAEVDLKRAVSELAQRRHYLAELAEIGKLGATSHHP